MNSDQRVTVHRTIYFSFLKFFLFFLFYLIFLFQEPGIFFRKFGSDTKLIWDRGDLRVCGGILWNWARTVEVGIGFDQDRNLDLGFTA